MQALFTFCAAVLAVSCLAPEVGCSATVDEVVRLHGWNAFIAFKRYPVVLCTVPKVGCTAIRQWVLNFSPEQFVRCELEIKRNNTMRLHDPACQSLQHFRNLTRFKKSGMTKFKMHCRQRHLDPSEYLLGKERCMSNTAEYSMRRKPLVSTLESAYTATFVRHPIDRFVSWFVDKVLMSPSDHSRIHVPRDFDLALLSKPGFGVSAMIKNFRTRKTRFFSCHGALDEHYATQKCMCRHDVVRYKFIGKLENMRQDFFEFVSEMSSRWKGEQNTKRNTLASALPTDMNVKGTSTLTRHVRGNLTMEDVLALYDIYQDDFLLFNYTINEWWKKHKFAQ